MKRYLWGGRRLESVLGKPLPAGDDYAESWEIADHADDQSRVAAGPLAGATLRELMEQHGSELLGRHHPQRRFPLLFKFLDSSKVLSVQVHPDNAAAALLAPPDLGKTEAWLVLHAQPGAVAYAGLKQGIDRPQLEAAVRNGDLESCLHTLRPQAGECLFIPAGVVHALGAGFVIAEIQQASNTTYRLHDWNRLGPDGKPRKLHIEESLRAIDYAYGPVSPQRIETGDDPHVERLVTCDKFVLDRRRITSEASVGGDDRFHIISVLSGTVDVAGDASGAPLKQGQTLLIPASTAVAPVRATADAVLIDMYLPD